MLYSTISVIHLIFLLVPLLESAKILGIFPMQSRSHHLFVDSIVKGLLGKGHEVSVISHFKANHTVPNYKEIIIGNEGGELSLIDSINIGESVFIDGIGFLKFFHPLEVQTFEQVLDLEYIKQLINSTAKHVDLIIAEAHVTRCYHLLADKLNVPLILVSPTSMTSTINYFDGNSYLPSIAPFVLHKFTTKMNFLQRLTNTYHHAWVHWYCNYEFNRDYMDRYARDVFNIELPSDEELKKRTALTLYNNHFSFMANPKPTNKVDIAGIHIKEVKKLPKDIEDFIEGANHGVIFFSFGSTIKASSISPEKLNIIKEVFSAIPQRVLWRVNELNITDVPPNVKLGKWFPQRDILEHKNVIGFISHCGLFGTLEAIHSATPIIGMPFAFDQFQNVNILVEKGVAIYVDYFTTNKDILINAINQIITDPKYRENMRRLSAAFKDRPMSPQDEAVYWIEYVLKHKGASHLRPVAADMPLYQYALLDVLSFILGIIIGIVYFCKFLVKIIIFRLRCETLRKSKIQ